MSNKSNLSMQMEKHHKKMIALIAPAFTYSSISHHFEHSWKGNPSPTSHHDTIQQGHLIKIIMTSYNVL